jgi:hypothetical protein
VYRAGDYVYPADLPHRCLCRVARADIAWTTGGAFQILTLEPLEGPWCAWLHAPGVIRFGDEVVPAHARDLWMGSGVAGSA